ncbi:uncharacterized protein EV154DRAFT_483057 [Mucor mucedo]|uniref:uncharacterized protein n=1 Tax=Mucor mucedo TaxID=29922 RepID=UPI00221E9F89|nr:uncharacterized protein EV154DRAFT_483057 [Mucor mucedo]KAI7889612.1 hypothetical protein EV154DRAFT_483057 [Mucor mucedo]
MQRSTFVYAKISGVLGRTFKASKQTDARKMKKATQESIQVDGSELEEEEQNSGKIMKISKLHHLFKAMFHFLKFNIFQLNVFYLLMTIFQPYFCLPSVKSIIEASLCRKIVSSLPYIFVDHYVFEALVG